MRIKHTDCSPSRQQLSTLRFTEALANWIMKTNPDGSPCSTSEELEQCHRRYSDENREID